MSPTQISLKEQRVPKFIIRGNMKVSRLKKIGKSRRRHCPSATQPTRGLRCHLASQGNRHARRAKRLQVARRQDQSGGRCLFTLSQFIVLTLTSTLHCTSLHTSYVSVPKVIHSCIVHNRKCTHSTHQRHQKLALWQAPSVWLRLVGAQALSNGKATWWNWVVASVIIGAVRLLTKVRETIVWAR